jgi:3-methyladenine DNA glycosylase AlkC
MPEKLKDILFPREKVQLFANLLVAVYPPFEAGKFENLVCDEKWPERELKEKMRHTTHCLHLFLPDDFSLTVDILKSIVPKVEGFEAIVLPDYVEVYGQEHWDISLPALGELTKCGSSEFAIRSFLNKNLKKAMEYMYRWAEDEDYRVRRFASEGCRPRLPWGAGVPALKKDPSPVIPILEKLKDDPELFVRKSVANNLNDISKDHPELVLDLCESWQGKSENTDWIIKQGCRTLLKKGNKRAMLLFGFANPGKINTGNLKLSNDSPAIGDEITFSFDVKVETSFKQKVRLEYIIHYVKSSGKTSPKVFQISETLLKKGTHRIKKKHSFANMSTRKHYPGEHKIEIVVNGKVKAAAILKLLS